MVKTALNSGFGLFLIGVGLFFSSSGLINFIRPFHEDVQGTLTSGALLFKLGLILTGVIIILLGRLFKSYPVKFVASTEEDGRIEWGIFFIVLCVAALLRIYRLNEGLWLDEILTQVNYTKASFGEIFTTYDSQNQHFLYSLLSHGSYLLFGESAWALRLPAVLFGLASIWALYKFSTEVSSKKEALLSCALFTFSYHHIWFSQNARGYTGLLFFALLTSWMLIKGFNENQPWQWVMYGIVAALGAYTHMTMVIIVFSHFIIYISRLYRNRREDQEKIWMPMVGFVLAGILTFQLYAIVLPQMLDGTFSQGSIVASWKNPLWTLMEFVKGVKVGLKGLIPGILGLAIFIAGLWGFVRRKPIVIELLFIPAFIVVFIAIVMGHHLWPRLFFFTFGFVVLIVARGCMQFGTMATQMLKLERKKSVLFGTGLFCTILFASAVSVPSVYGPKQDYLGALSFVESNREKTDVVFSVGSARFVYEKYYKVNWNGVEVAEDIESILKSSKRAWLVYTLPYHLEAVYPDIMLLIKNQFTVVEKYYGTLNGGEIYVCSKKG